MDGELWIGRGQFERTVSAVRNKLPDAAAWRELHFMVFDLPQQAGVFDQRLLAINEAVARINQPWVQVVAQTKIFTETALRAQLHAVVKIGGEGLMLHQGDSMYKSLRSDSLLKLKLYEDAEAVVVQHLPGKGKYQGVLGALLIQTLEGQVLRIGSGLSDALRHSPPPVGSWVTYRFRGTLPNGLPRFATFLRLREDAALSSAIDKLESISH